MRALVAVGSLVAGQPLVDLFRSEGHQAMVADTGQDTLALARRDKFDVIVVGLDLPDVQGADLVRSLRSMRKDQLILVLSPTSQVVARLAALASGADAVLTLPLDEAELGARLQALVRRRQGHGRGVLSAGPVSVNLDTCEVTVNGRLVNLTPGEGAVLELLMLRRDVPVTKATFLSQLYAEADEEPDPRIIDVFIFKVRKKLAAAGAPDVIETVPERGYMVRGSLAREQPRTGPRGAPMRGGPVHQKM